jgi:hypothetical protein
MEEKIDRPIVKMTRTRDDGGYDFYWYKTMMGKQSQIINIIKDTNKTLEELHNMDQTHINLLEDKIKRLETDVLKGNNRIFVFRPWKLFKKKKQNVGN